MRFVKLSKIDGTITNEDEVSVETTKSVLVNVESIRCFYARKGDTPGTRLTFNDGGGFAVSELPEDVAALIG